MNTINELKKVWLGIAIGYLSMPVLVAQYSTNGRITFSEFIRDYVITSTMVELLVMLIVTAAATWVIRILWKAIDTEFKDIANYIKNRRDSKQRA